MGKNETKVPRLFKRLLRWFCASELLEELEGDLEEAFEDHVEEKGKWYASYRYIKEVFFLLRPSVLKKRDGISLASPMMLRSYGKVAVRNFVKNKTYVAINILSMSVGLACCIVAYLNYDHNASFDSHHEQIDSIYRINFEQLETERTRHFGISPFSLSEEAKNSAYVTDVVRYWEWSGEIDRDNTFFEVNMGYVTENFMEMFSYPLVYGSQEALSRRTSIIISEGLAMKIFGKLDTVGESVLYIHEGEERLYTVEGVFRNPPSNSSIQIDALTHIDNTGNRSAVESRDATYSTTFLLIPDHERVEQVEKHLQNYAAENVEWNDEKVRTFYLDPLQGMAKHAAKNDVVGPMEIAFPWPMEVIPGIISICILLIACMTFTNTSIASAAGRLKEIGVRKVMGGMKSQVITQFLTESLLICLLAIICAIPLSKYLAQEFSQLLPMLDIKLVFTNNIPFFLFLVALLCIAGFIAGGYPAFYLSKFQPSKILKGNLKYKSVGRLTKVLLTAQFAFSMLTITASVLFIQNAQYQNEMDLGFDTDETLVIRLQGYKQHYNSIQQALSTNPSISSVTGSADHVGRRYHNATITHKGQQMDIVGLDVGPKYLETVELELILGRDFDVERATDYSESVIVNESFVEAQGWEDPIGQQLTYQDTLNYYVVGVVKDFYFDAFNSPIQPLWIRFAKPEDFNYLIARTSATLIPEVTNQIKATWRELFNDELRSIRPASYAKNEAQLINGIILKVFIFMGTIAAIMSVVGFYYLVSLNLFGKMKEIGVRKVLGSTRWLVAKEVNKEYIYILIIGTLSGSIASYFLIPMFMAVMWSAYADSNMLTIIYSIGLMLFTCLFTVGTKVIRAAGKNPVYLLRDE